MNARARLVDLCRSLGDPARDLVILGEGNASARLDSDTFLVTASGTELSAVDAGDIVAVAAAPAAALARNHTARSSPIGPEELDALTVGSDAGRRVPSIETLLHAAILDRTEARYVGHTHPTAVLGLACSERVAEAFAEPIFPDEVVVCGPAYLVVPYASPGIALAAELDSALVRHSRDHGRWPNAIVLTGHGLIALGHTAAEVLAVTEMTAKSARIRTAALTTGGLRPLPADEVRALTDRADEQYRRRQLVEGPDGD